MEAADIIWHKVLDPTIRSTKFFPIDSVKTIEVNNQKVCVIRVSDGIKAVSDRCPHASASLGTGWYANNFVTCPLHNIKFNINTGRCMAGEDYRIKTYPVKETENAIYIGFRS